MNLHVHPTFFLYDRNVLLSVVPQLLCNKKFILHVKIAMNNGTWNLNSFNSFTLLCF